MNSHRNIPQISDFISLFEASQRQKLSWVHAVNACIDEGEFMEIRDVKISVKFLCGCGNIKISKNCAKSMKKKTLNQHKQN